MDIPSSTRHSVEHSSRKNPSSGWYTALQYRQTVLLFNMHFDSQRLPGSWSCDILCEIHEAFKGVLFMSPLIVLTEKFLLCFILFIEVL